MGAVCFYCSPMRAWRISNVIVWIKQCLILTKRQTTDVCCNGGGPTSRHRSSLDVSLVILCLCEWALMQPSDVGTWYHMTSYSVTTGIEQTTILWPCRLIGSKDPVVFKLKFCDAGEGCMARFNHILPVSALYQSRSVEKRFYAMCYCNTLL